MSFLAKKYTPGSERAWSTARRLTYASAEEEMRPTLPDLPWGVTEALKGLRRSFSAHVRLGEHGLDKEEGFSDPRESLEGGTERLWDQEKPYEDYRM